MVRGLLDAESYWNQLLSNISKAPVRPRPPPPPAGPRAGPSPLPQKPAGDEQLLLNDFLGHMPEDVELQRIFQAGSWRPWREFKQRREFNQWCSRRMLSKPPPSVRAKWGARLSAAAQNDATIIMDRQRDGA
ncbi:hypothetical protein N9L68_06860 [bacterium]|nr:hypothetical protein [bacterium]